MTRHLLLGAPCAKRARVPARPARPPGAAPPAWPWPPVVLGPGDTADEVTGSWAPPVWPLPQSGEPAAPGCPEHQLPLAARRGRPRPTQAAGLGQGRARAPTARCRGPGPVPPPAACGSWAAGRGCWGPPGCPDGLLYVTPPHMERSLSSQSAAPSARPVASVGGLPPGAPKSGVHIPPPLPVPLSPRDPPVQQVFLPFGNSTAGGG